MESTESFAKALLLKHFLHQPTFGQVELIDKISSFLLNQKTDTIFILKGYAGTGKTTIISALVKTLPELKLKSVLLAPTGRAAKVLGNYSDKQAFTIHKKIYHKRANEDGVVNFVLAANLHTNTIFIVDEASMISNAGGLGYSKAFGNTSLLNDLINYVSQGTNCKLIFVGDTAQLPSVGLAISPALDEIYLQKNYNYKIEKTELTDVVRQKQLSGILENATDLRELLNQQNQTPKSKIRNPKFILNSFKDIVRINGSELEDALNEAYSRNGAEETMVICRSNSRANQYNQQIRARIRWQENEISAGDLMMVVKNNYFWLPEESKAGFIANGDIVEILKVLETKEIYGFRFADVNIRFVDYPDEPVLETKILLDTIMSEAPSLTQPENKRLYEAVLQDYLHIENKNSRFQKIRTDPFLNALQVKFAYAVTCHKAQGGQWNSVFVEQGYLTDEMLNTEYLRWLYTAVTRAKEKLYLVNFNKDFFEEE